MCHQNIGIFLNVVSMNEYFRTRTVSTFFYCVYLSKVVESVQNYSYFVGISTCTEGTSDVGLCFTISMQSNPDWKVSLLDRSNHVVKIVGHSQTAKLRTAVLLSFVPGLGLRYQFVLVDATCERLADEKKMII